MLYKIENDVPLTKMSPNRKKVFRKPSPRADIIKRCMNVVLSTPSVVGVHEISMREIARKAGISIPSIYRMFPSKDELLFAIIVEKLEEMTVDLREHRQGNVGTQDKLRKFTWLILHFFESNVGFTSLMFAAIPMRVWAAVWAGSSNRRPLAEQMRLLLDIVRDGQIAGEVRNDINYAMLRELYFGGIARLTITWLLRGRAYSLSEVSDDFAKSVFDFIKK